MDDALGLELRLLVSVAKSLVKVEVALGEGSGMRARDIGRRDVDEGVDAAPARAELSELDDPAGPVYVDRPGLLEAEGEGHGSGAVDDSPHPLCQPVTPGRSHAQPGLGDVAPDGDRPAPPALALADQGADEGPQSGLGVFVGAGANQYVHRGVVALEQPSEDLSAEESRAAREQRPCVPRAHLHTD